MDAPAVPHGHTAMRLTWPHLPAPLRARIEERLGSPVAEAVSQDSGFTPGFASVLTGADGSRLFVKAAHRSAQRYAAPAYAEEARKLVAFGDTATTAKAADILVKVHSKGIGHDPVTGRNYDANDPDSQLWIQVTGWHSILKSYQMFGGPKLTDAEIDQYWAECARAAELQTIDPADVPRSAEEVRAYYEKWRPDLEGTPLAQDMADFILTPGRSFPPGLPKWRRAMMLPVGYLVKWGTISTYPAHIKELLGVRQPRVLDLVAKVVLTAGFKVAHRVPALSIALLKVLSPSTVDVAAPILLGIPAEKQVTMTPREAQHLYGYDEPAKAHLELRARQHEKVFGRGEAPSDEGIVESQAIIGTTDVNRVGQLA